jgi:hypothetical protein
VPRDRAVVFDDHALSFWRVAGGNRTPQLSQNRT